MVYHSKSGTFKAHASIIMGMVPQVGIGKAFFRGMAAEHFCVCDSGTVTRSRALVIIDASP